MNWIIIIFNNSIFFFHFFLYSRDPGKSEGVPLVRVGVWFSNFIRAPTYIKKMKLLLSYLSFGKKEEKTVQKIL